MATTTYGVGDPLAVKLWAKVLGVEALKATMLAKFIGSTGDSLIQRRDEMQKGPGDQVTYGLRMQLNSSGALGDGVLEGQEEALATYSDSLLINQLRNGVRVVGRMSQQRVPFEIRDEAAAGLKDWWADRFDWAGFNQLCGNVGPSGSSATVPLTGIDIRWTGNNQPIATDAGHYTNTAGTGDDTGLSSGNLFTLSMLDKAVERAQTVSPAIRPVNVNGKRMYVAFLHPYQVTDLRTATSSGQWLDIQKAAMTGGQISDNPIFDGSLGVYNNVILHSDYRVTQGYNPSGFAAIATVRRAVFCGAQAAMMAFGRDNDEDRFTWAEAFFDYSNQLGVSAGAIFGLKKTVFNSADFATIVMSSYAAQH